MQRQVKVEKLRQIIKGKCLIIVKMKGWPKRYANISVIAFCAEFVSPRQECWECEGCLKMCASAKSQSCDAMYCNAAHANGTERWVAPRAVQVMKQTGKYKLVKCYPLKQVRTLVLSHRKWRECFSGGFNSKFRARPNCPRPIAAMVQTQSLRSCSMQQYKGDFPELLLVGFSTFTCSCSCNRISRNMHGNLIRDTELSTFWF